MQNLLNFLYRFRTFGLFLLLEVVCFWLVVSYNNRQNASFLNSSNVLVAGTNTFASNVRNYFGLQEVNRQLVAENELLRRQLANSTLGRPHYDTLAGTKYRMISAKVISNTFRRAMNYVTIDIGAENGISPGMGVVSGAGVVGQVKSVSSRFATVTSLLHRNLMVSASVKGSNALGTIQWDSQSPLQSPLRYVPRHISLNEGDTVWTSGYNAIFPPEVMIGTINSIHLDDNDVFYDIMVNLSVDFSRLDYLFVIENKLKEEQDSLQANLM